MKNYLVFITLFFALSTNVRSQDIATESSTHIFWQPDRKLKISDFQGDPNSNIRNKERCDSSNMCTVAYIGVFSILDVPKSKKDMGKLFEKAYFTPAFEIGKSFMFDVNDTLGLKKQQLIFDIYELSAREARKRINEIYEQMGKPYGAIHLAYKRIKEDTEKYRNEICDAYTHDVYINNEDGAYEKWRSRVDEWLEELEGYGTTADDCYRFVILKPTNKKYEQAKYIY